MIVVNMMEKSQRENNTYLIFGHGGNKIFNIFLKKGFTHIFVVRKLRKGWIVIDPCRSSLKTKIVDADFNLLDFYLRKGFKVVQIFYWPNIRPNRRFIPQFIPLLTCVTFAKYAAHIKCSCLTPWQLYNCFKSCTCHSARELTL